LRWDISFEKGTVAHLHERSAALVAGAAQGPTVLAMEPADSALVLGSSQPESVVDGLESARAGVSIVRRRSGGGAVLVRPGAQLWVDFFVPAGDELWDADVGRAALWLGEAWAAALVSIGMPEAKVWKGSLARRPWSSLACFALLGAGEVTSGQGRASPSPLGPAKVVGVSQRRTTAGALFQCSCLLRWEPGDLVALLAIPKGQRRNAARDLQHVAMPAPAGRGGQILEALLAALP
jgi:lipoate---protein ligase